MLTINYGKTADSRHQILSDLRAIRAENPKYRVIDIGGAVNGWTAPVVDLVVDVNAKDTNSSWKLDICKQESWDKIIKFTESQGQYDYAICTHTLEDIYNPFTVLDMLPKIARAGIITMPSIRAELSRPESATWIGYIHHRWIFDQRDTEMLVIPKLEMLGALVWNAVKYIPATEEIIFRWRDSIPYSIFMNNYLGPDSATVVEEYRKIIENIKC